jgi:hypothetical protein
MPAYTPGATGEVTPYGEDPTTGGGGIAPLYGGGAVAPGTMMIWGGGTPGDGAKPYRGWATGRGGNARSAAFAPKDSIVKNAIAAPNRSRRMTVSFA